MTKTKLRSLSAKLLIAGCVLAVFSISLTTASLQSAFNEGFEVGGKKGYAAANVTFGTGSWFLDDALTGSLANDRKEGSFSVRVRNKGVVRMAFDRAGAGTVSIQHAVYGSDGSSTWELWSSIDNGGTWTQVGRSVTSDSTAFRTASFAVNSGKPIRFEIRKTSGEANRLNFDNIQISNFGSQPTAKQPVARGSRSQTSTSSSASTAGEHLTMGNPSNADPNTAHATNYLMEKPQYAESYNRDRGEANWVSWHLDAGWLGDAPRQNDFRPDSTLPLGWYQVQAKDYAGSGFDRGHMSPSADRTVTISANSATFLMTNMIPQLPANNQGPWGRLEGYCRGLVSLGNELYIVSGGLGLQSYIANGRVAVPARTWKVIIILPNGNDDVARVNKATRTIAVVMPNAGPLNSDWRAYRVSVDRVEELTGFDFFSNVSSEVQTVIEERVDNQ
jgi:endonuclease G